MMAERVAPAGAFAGATRGYWLGVYPSVRGELRRWRTRAALIGDPALRALALQALSKRGNMEGAAAFATFVPRAQREAVVRATVAFQAAYNHLDVLSEQPGPDRVQNARRMHQALLDALVPHHGGPVPGNGGHGPDQGDSDQGDPLHPLRAPLGQGLLPATSDPGYCALSGFGEDCGYLLALLDACRDALAELPSYAAVAPAARRAAERVVAFQSFNRGYAQGDHEALRRWADAHAPAGSGLAWWETAAAAGSSLGVHVMLATAAGQAVEPSHIDTLESAYFPWVGALHSLLDQLIDRTEDARTGQRNLLDYYASPREATERIAWLAQRSLGCVRALPGSGRHPLIVAAMASFYLSSPEARAPGARSVAQAVLDTLGPPAKPAMTVFRARRVAGRVYCACR